MKTYLKFLSTSLLVLTAFSCADNSLDELPLDNNYPFRIVLDTDEGADLSDAEDYSLEIKFADYLPDLELPESAITLSYRIDDLEDDMIDQVKIDKVVYEVEIDDCVYERELDFTASEDGLSGTIVVTQDSDLKSVPESFEVVFTLPGVSDSEGAFTFLLTDIKTTENVLLGSPRIFNYEVLDNELAGEWELELSSEEEFESFKAIFGLLNADIAKLNFSDITGKVKAEYEFKEMKFELELTETVEVTSCEDGETETEEVNKVIEWEADYDAEDGEVKFEGSRAVINDNGLVETELDFILEARYELDSDNEILHLAFIKLIDEDSFKAGDELFADEKGVSFTFAKD